MDPVNLHLSGYAFFDLEDPAAFKALLESRKFPLRGSILLAPEGINLYLSGAETEIRAFLDWLREQNVPPLTTNESRIEKHPYGRLRIKLKKEIVTSGLDPRYRGAPGPDIAPATLSQWLDEKKAFTLLDTRNAFEVSLGKFEGAKDLGVASFREFTQKARELPESIKTRPLVMYCTGGIRCEKSSAQFLRELGFAEVYKLQGGILNYFREVGGKHWTGECFVFDERVAVDETLSATGTRLCPDCQWPIVAGARCERCCRD